MEQLAAPGSILLTAATLWLVEGLVRVQRLGPVPVKAWRNRWRCSNWLGVTALRRRLQAATARGLSPFVGRQPELAALRQALAQAGAGQGQVIALIGEPGVGKSRPGRPVPRRALHAGLAAPGEQLGVRREGHRVPASE